MDVRAALLLATLLGLAGVVVAVWLLWRARPARIARRRKPPIRTRFPVVLAHGLFGFDEIRLVLRRHEYFRGIPRWLRQLGAEVHTPRVPPISAVAVRAQELADQVRSLPARRVNIIAHSMGGLDARYAVSRLGLSDRVASVTTLGTPHHGVPIVDLGTGVGQKVGLALLGRALGVELHAFYDLTTEKMAQFNRTVPDALGVMYGCVLAAPKAGERINPLLLPAFLYMRALHGDNDGLVSVPSQTWGDVIARTEADHLAQIGWWKGFDARALYEELFRELRARGL